MEGLEEVPESECFAAGMALGSAAGYDMRNTHLYTGEWDYTPCGCFLVSDKLVFTFPL